MATLALPITALFPAVDEAKAETKQVVVCSRAETRNKMIVLKIAWKTLALRHKFADLTHKQTQLLGCLSQHDFSNVSTDELNDLAASIDKLVAGERDILEQAHKLGAEIRTWWYSSLVKLLDQVEHLESIAESLHVATDPEASMLMGVAIGQFTAKAAASGRFAMKS